MSGEVSPEDLAWLAARDQLIAQIGPARLAEAEFRDIGMQMLFDAGARIMAAEEAAERRKSMNFYSRPAEEGWGWLD